MHPINNRDLELEVLFKSAFLFYIAMVTFQLHQLWRLPRIKEHYRRLPTRKELVEDLIVAVVCSKDVRRRGEADEAFARCHMAPIDVRA